MLACGRPPTQEHAVVLFANDPPAYREALSRAIGQRTGLEVAALPVHRSVHDGIRTTEAALVVTSGSEEAAVRLSGLIAVVNLTYEEEERATAYRGGGRVEARSLQGLEDLAEMIRGTAPAVR